MSSIKAYIKEDYKNRNGTYPVSCCVWINRQRVRIACGISVAKENWDSSVGKVNRKDPNYKDRNLIINHVQARMNDIIVHYRLRNEPLTKDIFLKEYHNPVDFSLFFDFVSFYQKLRFKEIEQSTAIYHQSVINKLREFSPGLRMSEMTEDFIREYAVYLKDHHGNKQITINKNLATIKIYVRDAIKRGYLKHNPFEDIRIKRERKEAGYLRENELHDLFQLYRSESLPKNLQKSIEFFLFMCFTSLHIADAKSVTMEQIGNDSLSYYRIKNRNSKPEIIVIPLSDPAKFIIKRVTKYRVKGKIFEDMYPDQRVNKMIKKVATMCGITKNISAKTGRHTFATIYLKRTNDMRTLQKILGHSSIQETMIYSHVLDEQPQEGIKVFNDFLK